MFQPSWNDGLTRFDQLIALHFLSFLFQIKLVPSPDNVCLFLGAMVHFKSNYAKEELVLKKKIIRYLHLRYETLGININFKCQSRRWNGNQYQHIYQTYINHIHVILLIKYSYLSSWVLALSSLCPNLFQFAVNPMVNRKTKIIKYFLPEVCSVHVVFVAMSWKRNDET